MASHYDLAIAGGSFAGLVCARSAALRGLRTLVLERQPAPGAQVRTTGILVKEVAERWEVPSRLVRRIRGVRLYGPSLVPHRSGVRPATTSSPPTPRG